MAKSQVRLSFTQRRQLFDAIKAYLEQERFKTFATYEKAAKHFAKELGFPITRSHISSMKKEKDIGDFQRMMEAAHSDGVSNIWNRIHDLEQEVKDLTQTVTELEGMITKPRNGGQQASLLKE